MTRAQQIRKEVLLQTYGASRLTFSPEQILRGARNSGIDDATKSEILDAIYFHKSQGFLSSATNQTSGEVRYQITGQGILEFEKTSSEL